MCIKVWDDAKINFCKSRITSYNILCQINWSLLFTKVAWPFNFLSYWLNWPYCSVTSLIGRYQCYRLVLILVQDYKCQVICKETNWINQKIQSASSFVLFIFLYYWRCATLHTPWKRSLKCHNMNFHRLSVVCLRKVTVWNFAIHWVGLNLSI